MNRHAEPPLEETEVQEVLRLRVEEEFGQVELAAKTVEKPKIARWVLAGIAAGAIVGYALIPRLTSETSLPPSMHSLIPEGFSGIHEDFSFHPSKPMAEGLKLSGTVGFTMYSTGSADTLAQLPEGPRAKAVEDRIVELMEFVRDNAEADTQIASLAGKDPRVSTKFPHKWLVLSLDWRNGTASCSIEVPRHQGPQEDADLKRIAHNASETLTQAVADGMDFINHRED